MYSSSVWLLATCSSILLQLGSSIPLDDFYPYGLERGDSTLPFTVDGSSPPLNISSRDFPFFSSNHSTIFVNNNGIISLGSEFRNFTPVPFPIRNVDLIAPYWADVDTSGGNNGRVFYREASTESDVIMRARNQIRMTFVSQANFQPNFVFIATWERVGFFVAPSTLRNTFQCVLVSDGQTSFSLFLYADGEIQWSSSQGTGGGINGTGGNDARVGFNSADSNNFTVPESGTPNIINIDSTSNVGIAGVWIFRVDQVENLPAMCNDTNPLEIFPAIGNMLGGTAVSISGPCFQPQDDISCMFGSSMVTGIYISEVLAVCVTPYLERRGFTDLTVTIWPSGEERDILNMRYSQQTRFYASRIETSSDVLFSDPELGVKALPPFHFTPGVDVTVSWNRSAFFEHMADPSSFVVDIALSEMDLRTGVWNRVTRLASAVNNSENINVTFPRILNEEAIAEVRPMVIEVVVASVPTILNTQGGSLNISFPEFVQVVKRWSTIGYYSLTTSLSSACDRWRQEQRNGIGEELLARLPPCPRSMTQAMAPNSGFQRIDSLAINSINQFFHPGARTCFRQTTFSESHMQSGQECCYLGNGILATGPTAGGTADLVSPEISLREHIIADVIPTITCCLVPLSNCFLYYEERPSDNGDRYNPPPPGCAFGDPHMKTLDGFSYTFNGVGEYILIQTPDDRFTLQGRMEVPDDLIDSPQPINATVFTALAAKAAWSDTVQFQLANGSQSLEMLVNGELVDFSVLTEQELNNVTVTDRGNNTLLAVFTTGVFLEVGEQNGIIASILISLAGDFGGDTAGLMGNFNNDTTDDLMPRPPPEGMAPPAIPLNSSLKVIHNQFGLTWIISNASDSLFTYEDGASFQTLFNRHMYVPTFTPMFASADLKMRAMEMCNRDPLCLFDAAVTGSLDIGLSTLMVNVNYNTTVRISLPVNCIPACENNGVCIATNRCSCSMGYSGSDCSVEVYSVCDVNPCENGGSCRLRAGSYICNCMEGFTGSHCGIIDPVCDQCRQELECSFAAMYSSQESQVIPTSTRLQCVVDDSFGTGGDQQQEGSGFAVSPYAIDETFNATFLSAGSFLFLQTVGVISRVDGITSCSLQGANQEQSSLFSLLSNPEQFTLILQRASESGDEVAGPFESLRVPISIQTQDFDSSVGGQLDEYLSCSLQFLHKLLMQQPANSTSYSCLNVPPGFADPSTVVTFRVFCG